MDALKPIRGARFTTRALEMAVFSRESLAERRDVGEVGTVVEMVNVESI